MRGQRYKKSGWYGESHRHYLAAKGIKTRYNADKMPMHLRTQYGLQMMSHRLPEVPVDVKEDVPDIPAEVRDDMEFQSGFKLTDAAAMPGSLAKDAGGVIGDMISFAKDMTRK